MDHRSRCGSEMTPGADSLGPPLADRVFVAVCTMGVLTFEVAFWLALS